MLQLTSFCCNIEIMLIQRLMKPLCPPFPWYVLAYYITVEGKKKKHNKLVGHWYFVTKNSSIYTKKN